MCKRMLPILIEWRAMQAESCMENQTAYKSLNSLVLLNLRSLRALVAVSLHFNATSTSPRCSATVISSVCQECHTWSRWQQWLQDSNCSKTIDYRHLAEQACTGPLRIRGLPSQGRNFDLCGLCEGCPWAVIKMRGLMHHAVLCPKTMAYFETNPLLMLRVHARNIDCHLSAALMTSMQLHFTTFHTQATSSFFVFNVLLPSTLSNYFFLRGSPPLKLISEEGFA